MRQELGIRCLDVLGASVGLLLALPVLAVVAVFVKANSPGPVFCRQVYAGVDRRRRQRRIMNLPLAADRRQPEKRKKDLHGKPFTVYHFRTTHCGAAKEELATLPFASDLYTTSIGRRLRGWRLDELPILWNVLRGEMSLVGPRPQPPGLIGKRANEEKINLASLARQRRFFAAHAITPSKPNTPKAIQKGRSAAAEWNKPPRVPGKGNTTVIVICRAGI